MRLRLRMIFLAAGAAAAFGCGTQAPEAQPEVPRRVISLVPAVTEMLFAMGAGDRVVGVSSFDRYPPAVESLPKVGALIDPDVERILSLRPDLVVAYESQKDLIAQLAQAAIPVFSYVHKGLPDVTRTIRDLGARLGLQERSADLARSIEAQVDATRTRVAGRARPRTLVVFGREAGSLRGVYASGGTGFVHDMLEAAGGENVFAEIGREAVQATTEQIIARAPDVILELRVDPLDAEVEARERRAWQALASVPAVRDGRVHLISDPRTVIPGPRVAAGVDRIAEALQQDR